MRLMNYETINLGWNDDAPEESLYNFKFLEVKQAEKLPLGFLRRDPFTPLTSTQYILPQIISSQKMHVVSFASVSAHLMGFPSALSINKHAIFVSSLNEKHPEEFLAAI